ncbi:hypothetical protein CCYA_CCYA17G4403 [Cyanidiococcus yangmingshanensis]|uniref:Large ribosomal subunit protein bL21m n=1 Tax=Cyanidiococcus yangmingshanensis TaxID=2690220 RepID=A0A7J7IDF1_9RHOD|nr:ribosomal protein l21 [Cyanidiococcus yangmingshanensis]KAK4533521.1 hypothetical protein CCYA_CCYA17G4403 [Cyanidiococcus yangmingshanensis]
MGWLSLTFRSFAGAARRFGSQRESLRRSLTFKASESGPDSIEASKGTPVNELTGALGYSYYVINRKLDENKAALPAIFIKHPSGADQSAAVDKKRDPLVDGRGSGWFAVIARGPKQYKVTVGDIVYLDRLEGEVSHEVRFPEVLALGSVDWSVIGRPYVPGAEAVATIEEQSLSQKIYIYKKKRRKGYERLLGHRQPYTRVHITEIRWQVPEDNELEPLLFEHVA